MSPYRCGEDPIKPIPLSEENIKPFDKNNPYYRRTLGNVDEDGFKDFNIYLDLMNFNYEVVKYNLSNIKNLLEEGMIKAINTLQTLLKVKPTANYFFSDEKLKNISINYWNASVIGNTSKGMKELGIDLYIFARFDDLGDSTLASAGARFLGSGGQPLVGIVNINKKVDYSKVNSLQYFEGIIIHEFTHILGFANSFFTNYFNNVFSKVDKYGVKRAYINSPKVLETAKKYFNCSTIEGVELEEYGGTGTVGSHWEARILLGDYMNGYTYTPMQVISELKMH